MKLLIGFDNEAAIANLRKEFSKRGYNVEIVQKHSKASVLEYVNKNLDCHMVLLMENHMQGKYTADELAKITDVNDNLNVVLIVDEARRGTAFLKQLYSAGIYSVIYQNISDKKGVSIPKIVDLLLHKRSKPEARQYYGIDEIAVEMESTPYYVLQQHFDIIRTGENYGPNVGVRFYNVAQQLSTPQNVELIKNMPPDLFNQLKQYEEFYDIVQQIEDYGIPTGIVRPKELKRGSVQVGKNLLGVSGKDIDNMEQMNFNQLCRQFQKEKQPMQKNSYNSSAFHSMPLMQQANMKSTCNPNEENAEFEEMNRQYQQPMFSPREQTNFSKNNFRKYNSYDNSASEESDVLTGRKHHNVKKMVTIGGVAAIVVVIFTVGVLSLLKNKPTVIAKEQPATLETSVEESYAVMEDMEENMVEAESYNAETVKDTSDVTEYSEEEFAENNVEQTADEDTNSLIDVTTIVSEGAVVNQLVVDNIMTQYEEDFNFVVYGLNDTASTESSDEDGVEAEGENKEDSMEEGISDKYYKVSLSKPGSITFIEITLE